MSQTIQQLPFTSTDQYLNWFPESNYKPTDNVITHTTLFPSRFLLTGPGAILRIDKSSKSEIKHYRWEMHVNDLCQMINNYCEPGALVVDSTAGTLKTAIAALRTGRRCIVIEKDQDLVPVATKRLYAAYRFYNSREMLMSVGVAPVAPRGWELLGLTWQSEWQVDLVEEVRIVPHYAHIHTYRTHSVVLAGQSQREEEVQRAETKREGSAHR